MNSLVQRIESNAAVLAGAIVAMLNIVAVSGVWQPSGTTLAAINAAVAAVLAFLVQAVPNLQSRRVRREYLLRARHEPLQVVATAGSITGEVVGRDDLCHVLIESLRDRGTRRPQVIVGGVESGKTALLVRLTMMFAERGALPIPVRLWDAQENLDFLELARTRFLSDANTSVLVDADAEKIWRQLRRSEKIVVLADGLEHALVGASAERERDSLIRAAIRRANEERLPLIITSRPHDPLRATEAAILMLEPLSYEAALAYLSDGTGQDERRLAWIVETADVAETPLYLQITRDLHVKGLVDPGSAGQHGVVDTRGVDRLRLRLSLLETWERALISGYLREDVPLNRAERQAAIEHLSALACVGIKRDRLEVEFDDCPEQKISEEVQRRLAVMGEDARHETAVRYLDVRLGAAWAAQLDLVELRGGSVRFPHSLMQAYLGSRLLDAAIQDPGYRSEALQHPGPGREFLTALVLRSRAVESANAWRRDSAGREANTGHHRGRSPDLPPARFAQQGTVALLREAAAARDDNKVLDIYAAALEIDCGEAEPSHRAIAEEIKERWSRIHALDPQTLEAAKLTLVRRFGAAARTMDDRRQRGDRSAGKPAYRELYAIGCRERSRPVQLAVAQEIGAGGDAAYRALRRVLVAPCLVCETERPARSAGKVDGLRPGPADETGTWQAFVMGAWLMPMLVGSAGATRNRRADEILSEHARADLGQWLRHVGWDERRPGEEDLPISVEIALAQGFKYAANRRPTHHEARPEVRMYLAEQALQMLTGTSYWFSQLTLIQALCLLNLSEEPRQPSARYGAKPEAIVQHWLDVAGRKSTDDSWKAGVAAEPHPFVREAAQLAVLALKTGQPQRYCWVDESGVVSQVGSRKTSAEPVHANHRLWIPPSAGWTALDGRAQQLVADVFLLLNLIDRGDQPSDNERRLKRSNRHDLPPCITRYRPALMPGRTVGMASSSAPGTSCLDRCAFGLCPYPPKGALPPRMELSEAFCHRQRELAGERSAIRRAAAPWQAIAPVRLRKFWGEMADRARGPRPRSAAGDRSRQRVG